MPSRILIIGEYGTCNGGENSFLTIVARLIDRGCEFHALVPPHSEFSSALEAKGCSLSPYSVHAPNGQRKSQETIRNELADQIESIQPDLVHCNSLSTSRLAGPVVRDLQIPSLGYLRDILKLSRQAIADINQLDVLVAVSNATRHWHCDQGIDRKKTCVIYNGVDAQLFFPPPVSGDTPFASLQNPIAKELGIPPDSPIAIFVGQIGIRKGVDTLIDLFLGVLQTLPQAHLLIVGQRHSQKQESVDYENRLMSQTQQSIFESNFHWLGHRSDTAAIMRQSDLLIHPARQEPLGRVLLEASASGIPIVSTSVGGTSEILAAENLQQWLFDPDDIPGMTQSVIDLLQNPALRRSIGVQLRAIAVEHFSVNRCSNELWECYRQILNR